MASSWMKLEAVEMGRSGQTWDLLGRESWDDLLMDQVPEWVGRSGMILRSGAGLTGKVVSPLKRWEEQGTRVGNQCFCLAMALEYRNLELRKRSGQERET